jgi:hypothetical protein
MSIKVRMTASERSNTSNRSPGGQPGLLGLMYEGHESGSATSNVGIDSPSETKNSSGSAVSEEEQQQQRIEAIYRFHRRNVNVWENVCKGEYFISICLLYIIVDSPIFFSARILLTAQKSRKS